MSKIKDEINTAMAKKMFHDWLDSNRPWARPEFETNVYPLMEEIVEKAAQFFTGETRPTNAQLQDREKWLLKFSEKLSEHPEGYEGPCACAECLENE